MDSTVVTTDLFTTAYCLASGVRLAGTRQGRYVVFVLDNSEGEAAAALDTWYNGTPTVDARDLAEHYRQLSGLVRACK